MGRALVLGTLIAAAVGLGEAIAGGQRGELLVVLAAHLFGGISGTLALWLALGLVPGLARRRDALAPALAAAGALASIAFFRAHLVWLAREEWTSTSHFVALGAAATAGLIVTLGAWWAIARLGRGTALWRWTTHRAAVGVALVAWAASAGVTARALLGPPRIQLGEAGLQSELPFNVLLITIDTLRQDRLSQYGYPRPTGAALEGLGFTRFDEAVAVANWTKPATASILTGTFPSTHTAVDYEHTLPASAVTLLEMLAERGAATGFCTGNVNASGLFGMDQGADFTIANPEVPPHPLAGTTLGELLRRGTHKLRYGPNLNRFALSFLEEARQRRFALYVHYNDPHTPYDPPAEILARYSSPLDGRDLLRPTGDAMTDQEKQRLEDRYDAEVENVVGAVAKLLRWLEEQALLEKTLVVILSDHGEHFEEHGFWTHGNTAYEELLRVPLLVRPPGLPAAPNVEAACSQVDVVPTILDYLGVPAPPHLQGESLRPLIESGERPEPRQILTECHWSDMWSVRLGRYKLIVQEPPHPEVQRLFDLRVDRAEMHDLALGEDGRPVVSRLNEDGERLRGALRDQALESNTTKIDPELEAALRSLGYVK